MSDVLPEGFEDLELYMDWALPTESTRNRKRWTATMQESQVFYDVMLGRAGDALAYLDEYDLEVLDTRQANLLNMCLALVECSISIEMYGETQPKFVFPIERFVPIHDSWPQARSMAAAR